MSRLVRRYRAALDLHALRQLAERKAEFDHALAKRDSDMAGEQVAEAEGALVVSVEDWVAAVSGASFAPQSSQVWAANVANCQTMLDAARQARNDVEAKRHQAAATHGMRRAERSSAHRVERNLHRKVARQADERLLVEHEHQMSRGAR